MKIITILFLFIFLSGFGSAPKYTDEQSPAKQSIDLAQYASADVLVNGMTCSMCAQGIEEKLYEDARIKYIDVDFDTKIVTVYFDPTQPINDTVIQTAIIYAGYEVLSIDYFPQTPEN